MMGLILAFVGVAKADVVTIGEGTGTTYYFPIDNYFNYSCTQQIYFAEELGTAGTINAISFYYNYGTAYTTPNITMYMKNVSRSEFSSTTDYEPLALGDIVWSGDIAPTAAGWYTFTLDTPFQYDGTSNLLVAFFDGTSGYPGTSYNWRQTTSPGSAYMALRYYSDSYCPDPYNLGSYSGSKMRYTYRSNVQIDITPGGGMEDKLHVKYVNADEEEVIDSLNLGVRPAGCWMEPFAFTMYSEGPNYTVTVLDFTPSDGMFVVEGEELPFQVAPNADVELTMGTNTTQEGVIERQFVAITEGNRAAHIWPIVVEMYAPETPDVWELACEEATSFPFTEMPASAHSMTLHNDYTLPFPEIPEGYDAVYKLTLDQDQMVSAEVTYGDNGKVALYAEDFYGEGGPMATNNYTGIGLGGAVASPFEAQIGEGTSTTGYFPFYTLYNYSIATALYTAAELQEAGVTTAPMSSLSWYATNAPGYAQQGITIWMANVDDVAAPSVSPLATGMTKVYTGSCTPEIGWNEFAFNEGSFAWDGTSNVLILCQRLNGTWNSTVYWQADNVGFNGMSYLYSDYTVYDVETTTYSMTTSAYRPNIIMTANGRSRDELTYDFESGMQGWTTIDADGDGFNWMLGSELMGTGYGHNGSSDVVLSQSYSNNYGALTPDNYLVSPQVNLGGSIHFYACAQDADWAAEHFGVAVSTTSNTNASAFTTIQEWTMAAKGTGAPTDHTRSGSRAQGTWYEYTVDLSAYSGMGYVAIRHFNCTDMFYLDVDDITIGEPGKGLDNNRAFSHYRVYRTNCYNDGPYTLDNTVVLACELHDTIYIDVEWADLAPGVYKWGVGCVYVGNRGEEIESEITWTEPTIVEGPVRDEPVIDTLQEPRESEIVWSNCLDKDMYLDHVTVNVLLNSADSPEGTVVALTNLNEYEQMQYPVEPVTLDGSGFYAWPTFRRGEYAVSVRLDGYEPIFDTVSIWQNTDLRYVMTEILYGTGNIYVSRTGWAMWGGAYMPNGNGNGNGTATSATGGCYACGPVNPVRPNRMSQCSNCGTTCVSNNNLCPRCGSTMTNLN